MSLAIGADPGVFDDRLCEPAEAGLLEKAGSTSPASLPADENAARLAHGVGIAAEPDMDIATHGVRTTEVVWAVVDLLRFAGKVQGRIEFVLDGLEIRKSTIEQGRGGPVPILIAWRSTAAGGETRPRFSGPEPPTWRCCATLAMPA